MPLAYYSGNPQSAPAPPRGTLAVRAIAILDDICGLLKSPVEFGRCKTCRSAEPGPQAINVMYRCHCPQMNRVFVRGRTEEFVVAVGGLEFPTDFGCIYYEPSSEVNAQT
jgi:hypothetical protein